MSSLAQHVQLEKTTCLADALTQSDFHN
uniref:Uncharacterized protein n=1 Tax=Anguilla anguilla TaxID=7936 RepID=A0A0E9PLI5_ANGAN